MAVTASADIGIDPHAALGRACERLLALQDAAGWWKGELETNVTIEAEDLLLREFLGVSDAEVTRRTANWIRSQQREDGSWGNFAGAPPDVSTTTEAYVALRLAGDPADASHMRQAANVVRGLGGVESARVFTHLWLALFGLWSWKQVPALPPEMTLAPSWVPLNPYDFACWARQTLVPLTIVWAERPVRALPFAIEELRTAAPSRAQARGGRWARAFRALDRALHGYERHPVKALRRLALARAEAWIVARQEADGSWGGIQPPWVYSLIALHLRGYAVDHPVIAAGLEGLERFAIVEDDVRRLEACQSPVWDTALALVALTDAGIDPEHPALLRAARWLLDEEVRVRGDWSVQRPRLEPGGWAFEFANDHYPDIDDTAEVVIALRRVRLEGADHARAQAAVARAVDWVRGMQSTGGGWAAFDADNVQERCRDIPFCDFGAVIDDPSADVTAHAIEMLAGEGRAQLPETRAGVAWLLAHQEPDGSWFGRWGVNYLYGTGAVVPALVAAGIAREHASVRRAIGWLVDHQNDDGGWGEDARSYSDPVWIGRGPSTPSQTAWALLALHAAGEAESEAARRGVHWLARSQQADGSWDEPWHTGTGFPGDFYINYHLYRLLFPLMALGRCLREPRPTP